MQVLVIDFIFQFDEVSYGCEGVSVAVWSDHGDFSVMGFIVDQIDRLISEWYPGMHLSLFCSSSLAPRPICDRFILTNGLPFFPYLGLEDLDEYGQMTVQRMIPCPSCTTSFRQQQLSQYIEDNGKLFGLLHHLRNPAFVHQFSLSVCALAAVGHDEIACEKHAEEAVALAHLVPDLLLSDLPPSLLIDRKQLDFQPTEKNKLGGGGAGEVYKAWYRGQPLAIKIFHSSKLSRSANIYSCLDNLGWELYVPWFAWIVNENR